MEILGNCLLLLIKFTDYLSNCQINWAFSLSYWNALETIGHSHNLELPGLGYPLTLNSSGSLTLFQLFFLFLSWVVPSLLSQLPPSSRIFYMLMFPQVHPKYSSFPWCTFSLISFLGFILFCSSTTPVFSLDLNRNIQLPPLPRSSTDTSKLAIGHTNHHLLQPDFSFMFCVSVSNYTQLTWNYWLPLLQPFQPVSLQALPNVTS